MTMRSIDHHIPIMPRPEASVVTKNVDDYIRETELLIKTAVHHQNRKYIKEAVTIVGSIFSYISLIAHRLIRD